MARARCRRAEIEVGTDPDAPAISVGGADVAGPIRTREVSNAVSAVAAVPQVRAYLIAMQREIIARAVAAGQGIVAEGRDIGTVVAPDGPVKVFLTASEAVRARRRSADLAGDPGVTVAVTQAEQARRDRRDAPQMARAADAVRDRLDRPRPGRGHQGDRRPGHEQDGGCRMDELSSLPGLEWPGQAAGPRARISPTCPRRSSRWSAGRTSASPPW